MSFGAELVWSWAAFLDKYSARRVQKIEGGETFVSITLFGSAVILLSWHSDHCGCAVITPSEKKKLISFSKGTGTIICALKSHLAGTEFLGASQIRRDKIIKLSFRKTLGAGFSSLRHVVLEAMGRYSNIMLLDEDDTVIETAKHIHPCDNAYRHILPGQLYILPPEFEGISLENFLKDPKQNAIENIAGFGRPFLKVASRLELKEAVFLLSQYYLTDTSSDFIPQNIGKYTTVMPFLHENAVRLDIDCCDTGKFLTLTPALEKGLGGRQKKIRDFIEKEINRRNKQADDINRLLENKDAAKFKKYGEIIVANIWQIEQGVSKAELPFYDEMGNISKEEVPLNPSLGASENAAVYFAKYKKITRAQERAAKLIEKIASETDELKEQMAMAGCACNDTLLAIEQELGIASIQKNKKPTKGEATLPPHKRFDLENAIVYAGLSAKGNRYVTFKIADSNDLWFHAEGIPGGHVILRFTSKTDDKTQNKLINFCAALAAKYSKASSANGIRVDYTLRKYVSPIKGSISGVTYREFKSVSSDAASLAEYENIDSSLSQQTD